jgi:hypothetical protein
MAAVKSCILGTLLKQLPLKLHNTCSRIHFNAPMERCADRQMSSTGVSLEIRVSSGEMLRSGEPKKLPIAIGQQQVNCSWPATMPSDALSVAQQCSSPVSKGPGWKE